MSFHYLISNIDSSISTTQFVWGSFTSLEMDPSYCLLACYYIATARSHMLPKRIDHFVSIHCNWKWAHRSIWSSDASREMRIEHERRLYLYYSKRQKKTIGRMCKQTDGEEVILEASETCEIWKAFDASQGNNKITKIFFSVSLLSRGAKPKPFRVHLLVQRWIPSFAELDFFRGFRCCWQRGCCYWFRSQWCCEWCRCYLRRHPMRSLVANCLNCIWTIFFSQTVCMAAVKDSKSFGNWFYFMRSQLKIEITAWRDWSDCNGHVWLTTHLCASK